MIGAVLGMEAIAVVDDLRSEVGHLGALLASLRETDWHKATAFREWSVFDHVAHLHVSDRTAVRAIESSVAFAAEAAEQMRVAAPTADWRGVAILGFSDGALMHARWHETAQRVVAGLTGTPDRTRIPWYGPALSVASFATARLMETWAHGETIRDALGISDPGTARLRHVCELGWRTRSFAQLIHRLPTDDTPIRVILSAPDGTLWTWGDPQADAAIEGAARDFARVVSQCRNVADTRLRVVGEAAVRWMRIAQCFVGGQSTPPAPGMRKTRTDEEEMAR